MPHSLRLINFGLLLLALFLGGCASAPGTSPEPTPEPIPTKEISGLRFYTSIPEKSDKFVLLYFEREDCFWCTLFEKDVIEQEEVLPSLRKNFTLVAIDASKRRDLLSRYDVYALPTAIILDRNGSEVMRLIY